MPKDSSRDPSSGISRRTLVRAGLGTIAAPAVLRVIPAKAQSRVIKIGHVSPKTGPLAGFGEADEFILAGLEQAFKDGVAIGGKRHPIKLLVKDSQSNPNRAAEVASDLILNGKIDLMLVASTPETTNPVADQCELNEMPCVSSIAPWQPWFFGRGGDPAKGFKWTYHFFWGLEDIIGVFTDLWQTMPTNKKVGALWPNDGDGRAWGDPERGFAPALKKLGFEMVDPGFFKPLLDDFSAQITAFKNAKVEIVTGVLIPPDFTTFWTQARQQGFRPKAVTVGKALLFPRSVEALGAIGEGLTTEVWWSPNHPFKSSLTGASSRDLAAAMTGLPGGAVTFMIVSIVAFVVLGSVLEGIPAIVLFGPLLFPIARQIGIHEVHYSMVVILAMGIGLFAPPFGVGYYAACAIGRVNPDEGMRPIWPYLLALLIGLLVVAAVPWISIGFL